MSTQTKRLLQAAALCGAALTLVASAQAQQAPAAGLKSAGALAFAPGGVLLVGDSLGGAVFAYETGDTARAGAGKVEIADLSGKVAALLGTTADQVTINDVAVNPASGNVYLSVTRGAGPTGAPALVKADRSGKLSELPLSTKHSRVELIDLPAAEGEGARSTRMQTITDLGFTQGKVIVAGLSNEEFSSNLRAIPYPFSAPTRGAGIEIYHGAHGQFETRSPIRTFMTYNVAGQPHILAAYTCTPLVRIPVAQLQPGAKVKGVTIAELGNRNQPLDMISYKKDGKDFILMSNSARGVMKMPAAGLESYAPITTRVADKAGVPYETIADLTGVRQLDKVDDTSAVVLVADGGATSLRTIGLP